jgi:AMP deaminase
MGKGKYNNFGELMKNIFDPLFEATRDPAAHPELHIMLSHIGAFDSVDDESVYDELLLLPTTTSPFEFNKKENPPYSYWCFYMAMNLKTLNRLREKRGLNTFWFKPHCGESGQVHHLATSFLLADSINHGVNLIQNEVLQYLYYITQIGLALCPMSNDSLFLKLKHSPVKKFHKIGMRMSLNTDDPLQFHTTDNPLVEEYLVSSKVFELSVTDLAEMTRSSVLMSSFDHDTKSRWLGPNYWLKCRVASNCPDFSNLSMIRAAFRQQALLRELRYIIYKAAALRSQSGYFPDLQVKLKDIIALADQTFHIQGDCEFYKPDKWVDIEALKRRI